MWKVTGATVSALLALNMSMLVRLAIAQDLPALSVVPSKVTLLLGETHTFRAVGKDGRLRRNVRWSIAPEHAAKLTVDNDEATIQAGESSSTVILTAYAEGDSSEASVEIRSGNSLPEGAIKWSVTELPGCKTMKITPAVPSANGPDIYAEEACPDGTYARAITDDGRELWRRNIGGSPAPVAPGAKKETQPAEHINFNTHTLCDDISSGMTKESVSKLAYDHNLQLGQKERQGNNWVFEDHNLRCTILFDAGRVVKTKRVFITD